MRPVLPLLLSLSLCAPALADWSGPIEQPLWSLPAAPGLSRWLIVHNLSSAAADGLYHVEVLERRQGQQPWQFQRLAAHLALTEQALPERLARALLRLPDEDLQLRAIRHIAQNGLNVRQGEEYLLRLLQRQTHPPYRGLLRDYRILFTTVDRAVEEIRRFGVAVSTRRREEEDCISYTIRIPKSAKKQAEPKDQLSLYA